MGWKSEELSSRLRSKITENPYAYKARTAVQSPKSERNETPTLDSTDEGKAKSDTRIIVRFIGYRVRLLDPDNFAGGCKDLLDGLRHADLISGDEPDKITFITEQRKVSHRSEEHTEIEIL